MAISVPFLMGWRCDMKMEYFTLFVHQWRSNQLIYDPCKQGTF